MPDSVLNYARIFKADASETKSGFAVGEYTVTWWHWREDATSL